MNQPEAQKIIDASIGHAVLVDGMLIPIVGRYGETYSPEGAEPHDEYCLSLRGWKEVGVYPDGNEFSVWYARAHGELPMESLDRVRRSLGNVEVGRTKRFYEEGIVAPNHQNYVFGKKRFGVNVFACFDVDCDTFETWVNYKPKKVDVLEPRPYGWRKVVDDNSQLVVIDVGKDTAMGATPINKDGLRGHPGEVWETIEVLGPEVAKLSYTVRLSPEEIRYQHYTVGDRFFSVLPGGPTGETKRGYWHLNKNLSDVPIVLLVNYQKE